MIITNDKIVLTKKECSFLSGFDESTAASIKRLDTWDAINDYVNALLLQYKHPFSAEEKLMKQLLINFNMELHSQISNSMMIKDNKFAYCKNNKFEEQPFSETLYKNIEKIEWQSMDSLPFSKGQLCSPGRTWVLDVKEVTPHIGTLLKNLPGQMQMISVTLRSLDEAEGLKLELTIDSIEDEYLHLYSTPWQLLENAVRNYFQKNKDNGITQLKYKLCCHADGGFWEPV
jgi:hypothetical protein